ncbi:hypothetical protein BLNAU_18591 [Blattamonas nauphoetae]|uniref:Uncharacterized protein n=1 Tax=Blattamonas nauphoetae TaxID=2049346 RepID=A0ABQ9X3Y3_9EUKA|nr:hypothetical protein BLNAU_18591 [Blattamonas nauphoetae]
MPIDVQSVIYPIVKVNRATTFPNENERRFIRDPYHGNEGSGRQSNVDSNQIESKKNKEIDRAVIVESAVTVSTDSAPSSIVMFCDSSYLAVQLDGLGVVIKDGLITISPRGSGEVSECGEKDECCSSVSVGLKTGLNQKQVDEKIILSIVHSSYFGSRMWVGSEDVEVEGKKRKRSRLEVEDRDA